MPSVISASRIAVTLVPIFSSGGQVIDLTSDEGVKARVPAAPSMKILMLILGLMGWAVVLHAQEAPGAFMVRPYISRGDLAASRFWTPSTIALVTLDGAAKAADSFVTRKNIAGGGEEFNPLARPFVHTTAVQVVATAGLLGAEIGAAYFLHKRRHDNLGRAVLLGGAAMNGLGAAASYKHRVANW